MFTGMVIKVFEDTDIQSYVDYIDKSGYYCEVQNDRIIVGKSKRNKYDAVELGRRLRLARCRMKLTRQDIAKRIWANPTTVGAWECGRNVPSDDYLRRFCKAVGLDEESLKEAVKL